MDDAKPKRRTLVGKAVETALIPLNAAISKPAQRAYLGTFLFVATSLLLLGVATVAYLLFYYNYVPQAGVDRLVHLQFGSGNPYGTASFSTALTSIQAYDVTLFLHLPRTPTNLAAGNFMLDVSLLAPSTPTSSAIIPTSVSLLNTSSTTLARSRRAAILTYASPMVQTASTLSGLPWHIIGWKTESEMLEVSVFEGVEFAKGWPNIPQSAKVVVEADEKMQFYEVGIRIVARFGGLKWILYHHRILSYLFFTTTFWSSSMLSMLLVWFVLSHFYSSTPSKTVPKTESDTNRTVIKTERSDSEAFDPTSMEDLSDTSRTFPTSSRQMPLHFTGHKKEGDEIKKEECEGLRSEAMQPLAVEADDEEEDERGFSSWRDSGIGTSRDDETGARVERRRRA